ncbi:S-adenosyl-L-methionine-dependent methyltransferase [Xylaria curta]|nr:S-adenosyl-L-methionine-dependent methyltransferase [Xylaria curta]
MALENYQTGPTTTMDMLHSHNVASPSEASLFTNGTYNKHHQTASEVPDALESTLHNLIESVSSALSALEGPLSEMLCFKLGHDSKLPDTKYSSLASRAVDVMHQAQKLLEPPSIILADHFLGYVSTKCLNAAVERGIPDILERKGAMPLQRLAEESRCCPDRLGQVLRILCSNGLFRYDDSRGQYSNNHVSRLLVSDHWTQWHNWVQLYGNQMYDVARGIPEAVRKDATKSAAQINYSTDLNMFQYFQEQGWGQLLHRTLSGGAEAQAPGIVEDYPWHKIDLAEGEVIIDLGGGGGGLIASILRRHEHLRGGIMDRPQVIEHAQSVFHGEDGAYTDVGDRVSSTHLISGDFLKEVPPSTVYTMKWCLHDWKDEEAVIILRNVRKALVQGPMSRLVVLESVLEDGHSQRIARYADVHMMMMTGHGLERTEKNWHDLAERSGWKIRAIYNLRNAWVKALDFVPN